MRSLVAAGVLLMARLAAFGQDIGLGLRIGAPLTDAFSTGTVTEEVNNFRRTDSYIDASKRLTIGPMLDIRLRRRFAIEFNALYRAIEYDIHTNVQESPPGTIPFDISVTRRNSAKTLQFPIIGKLYLNRGSVRTYAGAGFSYIVLFDVESQIRNGPASPIPLTVPELKDRTAPGIVANAGVQVDAGPVRIAQELRYTRWVSKPFEESLGGIVSRSDQFEVLVAFEWMR